MCRKIVTKSVIYLEAVLPALRYRPHRQPADGDDDGAGGNCGLGCDDDEVVLAQVCGQGRLEVLECEGGGGGEAPAASAAQFVNSRVLIGTSARNM